MRYLLAIPLLLLPLAVSADQGHDRARQALREGRVLPLTAIIERAQKAQPGDVLEVELEDEHGRLIYEVKVIDPSGKVIEVLLDASTGEVIGRKGKRR